MRAAYNYRQGPSPQIPANTTSRRTPYSGIYNESSSGENTSDHIQTYLNILGPRVTPILLSRDYNNPENLKNRLRIYALILLSISIFFWCWAVYNTWYLRKTSGTGLDLGIVSFMGTAISSSWLLHAALGGKWYDKEQRMGCFGNKKSKKRDDDDYLFGMDDNAPGGGRDRDAALKHAPPGKLLRAFVILTQSIVVANYLLGLLFAMTAGKRIYKYFATYCFTFSLLWTTAAFAGWVIVEFYRNAVSFSYGKEVMDSGRDCGGLFWRRINAANEYVFGADYYDDREYYDDDDVEEEEEEEIDDELKALVNGSGYS